jgi:hypothetical protein
MSYTNDFNKKVLCSSGGTLLAELATLPICTIKTIYQNNPNHSIRDSIKYIYGTSGYSGFIQASKPAIISQIISTSSKYTFYEILKKYRKTENSDFIGNSVNGMCSGILGSFITHPFDIWKNYKQRNQCFQYALKYASSKIKVLYRGYLGALGKNITLYSMLFPLNDYYKSIFDNVIISASLTTLTITLFIQPFDYYKVVKMANNKPKYPFRGLSLMLARSLPHFVITMWFTEKFQELI